MKFVEVVDIYTYHILYHFGSFICNNDCVIMFALKAVLKAADNGYQGHLMRELVSKDQKQ